MRHRQVRSPGYALRALAFASAAYVLEGCGGGTTVPAGRPVTAPGSVALPGTVLQTGAVSLPAGSSISAGTLQVANSLGANPIASGGTFTVDALSTGPQFTIVTGPTQQPLLLGFVGAGQSTIDTLTTAEVLVYFSAFLYLVPEPQRDQVLASLPTQPGITAVQQAIASAIVANPNVDIVSDPTVGAAVTSLLSAVTSSSAMHVPAAAGIARVQSLLQHRNPALVIASTTAASGVALNFDFPDGVDFVNSYRRSADAFIDEVSHVPTGSTQPVTDQAPDTNSPVAIAAVNGLNGTLGTIGDILNGNAAGTATDTSVVALPGVAGASQTNYRVMIVGPGFGAGASSSLTPREAQDQLDVSSTFMVTDIFLPFVAAVALPINSVVTPTSGPALSRIVSALSAVPAFATAASNGDVRGALAATVATVASDGNLQTAIVTAVLAFIATKVPQATVAKAIGAFFLKITAPFDLALFAIDKALVLTDLSNSNRADLIMLSVLPTKVTLTPATSTIPDSGHVTLTTNVANALQLGAGETLHYAYTCTGQNGSLTDGNSTVVCGTSGATFQSNAASVLYFANSTGTGTDTISVTLTEISGGVTKTTIGSAAASVSVGTTSVTLAASPPSINNSATSAVSAAVQFPGSPPPGTVTYTWTNTANNGHIVDPVSGARDSFTTSAATVTYTANSTGSGPDTISVKAQLTNGSATTSLGNAMTTITVSSYIITLRPNSQNVANSGTGNLAAAVVTSNGSPPPGTLTYTWNNTHHSYGHITDPVSGAVDSFTTTSADVTYTANATGTGSDTVGVSATLTNGSQVENIGAATPATVTVTSACGPSLLVTTYTGNGANVLEYSLPYSGSVNQLRTFTDGTGHTGQGLAQALDQTCNLYLSPVSGLVAKYAPPYSGAPITSGSDVPYATNGVVIDSSGHVFVACNSNSTVYELSSTFGTVINSIPVPEGATDLAIDPAQNVFVGSNGGGVSIIAPPYTTVTQTITSPQVDPGQRSIAVDANDNLFANQGHAVVVVAPPYGPDNTIATINYAGQGNGNGGIAVDASTGDLYVPNYYNNTIDVFPPPYSTASAHIPVTAPLDAAVGPPPSAASSSSAHRRAGTRR